MSEDANDRLLRRFERLRNDRSTWESHWQDCYAYALPQRDGLSGMTAGAKRTDRLFDGTAPDAVDQLAASLLAQLTPPWSRWFGLAPGRELADVERDAAGLVLDDTVAVLQGHFDRSNFAVEMHQCFLELVTVGTATLLFEEAPVGAESAFRFAAIPLSELYLEEGPEGRLDVTFRRSEMTIERLRARFPSAQLPDHVAGGPPQNESDVKLGIIEAVLPEKDSFAYTALLERERAGGGEPVVLRRGRFAHSPFINFRWLKAPGETYGRSPIMKALPDIKTANKVVELVLKNASIAVTGIWQADDDGVLNPANIKLVPGTIIPKAVGSAGLTPLEAPGRFDISEIILSDLRQRIRHALLVDKLGQIDGPRMTATEVLERSAEMARILGATYGRLQSELLNPLISRGLAILRRRSEIADLHIDGRYVALQYRSPLAQDQARQDVRNVALWIESLASLGPAALGAVDAAAAARWIGKTLGVPNELILPEAEPTPGADMVVPPLPDAPTGSGLPTESAGDVIQGMLGALGTPTGGGA